MFGIYEKFDVKKVSVVIDNAYSSWTCNSCGATGLGIISNNCPKCSQSFIKKGSNDE